MPTTPRGRRKVVLNDFKAKKMDEGAIDIEAADGTVFSVPPPELWPDEAQDFMPQKDYIGLAKLLLGGDDEYARFTAAGGSAALISAILADEHGATLGE